MDTFAVFGYLSAVGLLFTVGAEVAPASISDHYGNTANGTSDIIWVQPPAVKHPYSSDTGEEELDSSLQVIIEMANDFVERVTPTMLDYDVIKLLLNGDFDYGREYMDLIIPNIGLLICILIGIMFIILCPIVGLLLFCCRLAGNCGGDMVHKNQSECSCWCYTVTLMLCTLLLVGGMLCTCISGLQMTTSVDDIQDTVNDALNDVILFINNTAEEIDYLGVENYRFTVSVINRDLDNIGHLVGEPVYNNLSIGSGVHTVIDSALQLDKDSANVTRTFHLLNDSLSTLMAKSDLLSDNLTSVRDAIASVQSMSGCHITCQALGTNDLVVELALDQFPNIGEQIERIKDLQANNFTNLAREGLAEINTIPQRIENESITVVNDIKQELLAFEDVIRDGLEPVRSLTHETNEFDTVRDDVNELYEKTDDYDEYRFYPAIILTCLVLVVVILQLIGLTCGILGHDKQVTPTHRSYASNFGGYALLGASGLILLFAWLLMFLTTITFIVGAPLKSFICNPLTDPEYKIFHEILDEPGGVFDDYFLGRTLLDNGSIELKFSDVLEGCRNNLPSYRVLRFDQIFNLTEAVNYRDTVNIQSKLDSLSVDLSDVRILSPQTETQLNDFQHAIQLDILTIEEVLLSNTTSANLTDFADDLRVIANDGSNTDPAKAMLLSIADDLDVISTTIFVTVAMHQFEVFSKAVVLENSTYAVSVSINDTINEARSADSYLQNIGNTVIQHEALKFADRLLAVGDSYVDHTITTITEDVAQCRPLWNIWEAIVHKAMCSYLADVLNAFWFSLGWCVFVMVLSLIFNIKLAKYFRTMRYDADDSKGDIVMQPVSYGRGFPISFNRNRVVPIVEQ